MISAIGKSGARSSGPTGSPVPGCSTGCGALGMSARTLYQRRGISDSSSRNLVCSTCPRIVGSAPRCSVGEDAEYLFQNVLSFTLDEPHGGRREPPVCRPYLRTAPPRLHRAADAHVRNAPTSARGTT